MLNEMDAAQVCEVLDPRLHLFSIAVLVVDDRICFPRSGRANPKIQSKTKSFYA